MVSLWANVLVDMVKRELERQEMREEEMLEALQNVKKLAEKSAVSELVVEVEDYMAQLAKDDFNEKRYLQVSPLCQYYWPFTKLLLRAKKEVMLIEVPKWEAKFKDPINNAFKPKAAVNEGVGTFSMSNADDRHTALNPSVPIYA